MFIDETIRKLKSKQNLPKRKTVLSTRTPLGHKGGVKMPPSDSGLHTKDI